MSGEVSDVLYKPVSIEEGSTQKRWDSNLLYAIMYKTIGESSDGTASLVLRVNRDIREVKHDVYGKRQKWNFCRLPSALGTVESKYCICSE